MLQPQGAAVNNFVIQLALQLVGHLFNHTYFLFVFAFITFLNIPYIAIRLLRRALKFIKLLVMELLIWLIRYVIFMNLKLNVTSHVFMRLLCICDSFLRCNGKMLWKLLIYTEGLGCRYVLWQNFRFLLLNSRIPEIYVLWCFIWVQAERLSEFYEICRNLDIGRGEKFIKVEQVG